jgi:DNA-binding NarL/FixJ family response regulator
MADDHKIIRDGLRSLLDQQPDMQVLAEAENGREAIRLARQHRPDVMIMDISMPDLNGIDATRQVVSEVPGIKIIALSMHSDRHFVEGMLKVGVSGYLLKDCAFDELIRAIRAVMINQTYLSPGIAGTVIKDYVNHLSSNIPEESVELSTREREVLQLIAEGKTTKQIAGNLNISIKTIESHRRKIMDKLNLHTIAELTKYALRAGLTSLET